VKQQTEHIGEFSFVFPRSITKGVCAGQRGVVVSVLRPQPDAGGAGAAFKPSVGSGSLREGKAGSGGLLTESLMKFKTWHLRGNFFRKKLKGICNNFAFLIKISTKFQFVLSFSRS